MKLTPWEKDSLVVRGIFRHSGLLETEYAEEIIEGSTPIIWFGDPSPKNWVTIATNPSKREFLKDHGELLVGDNARHFVRRSSIEVPDVSLDLEDIINPYQTYFYRRTAYRSWFGKTSKLE